MRGAMIQQILDPDFMDEKSRAVQGILELQARKIQAGDAVAARQAENNGVTKNDLEEALAALKAAESPARERTELTWMPRDPVLCLLQSTLSEGYLDANATDSP